MAMSKLFTRHQLVALVLFVGTFLPVAHVVEARVTEHPLDGISPDEMRRVVDILKMQGHASHDSLFSLIELAEPKKSFVVDWSIGQPFPRRANAHFRKGDKFFKAIVNLRKNIVESIGSLGGQPMILFDDYTRSIAITLGNREFRAGLAKRDLEPNDVFCFPLTTGNFGNGGEVAKRIVRVPCYVNPTESNYYARPVEGLHAIVDMSSGSVLSVVDEGVVPIPKDPWGYTDAELKKRLGSLRPKINPATLSQSGGANFKISGSQIEWDIWKLRYRVEKRPGVILSDINIKDGKHWRSILYQVHLSEVFVPYMDPSASWYWRTYMDSGEYGFGIFLSPLRAGIDCPKLSTFLTAFVHKDNGDPLEVPNAICVFERNIGDPAWRHFEVLTESDSGYTPTEGRPDTQLVVRSASAVGHYDYLVDYVFHQNGSMDILVGSTGIDAVKAVRSASMADATASEDNKFGTLIAPNLVAPNHDHYFNFRLDFDIDGRANTFMRTALVAGSPYSKAVRRSYWVKQTTPVESELGGRFRIDPAKPAMYHIMNAGVKGPLGHKPGYMIVPNNSVAYGPLDVATDPPMKRNAYINYTIWNTPYHPEERYAGGKFAFASDGTDTLATWVQMDRPLINTDIVTWYTMGFHHVPRTEDWPVMSTVWKGIYLRPFNFFLQNPASSIRTPSQ